jgi:hypothetical protein
VFNLAFETVLTTKRERKTFDRVYSNVVKGINLAKAGPEKYHKLQSQALLLTLLELDYLCVEMDDTDGDIRITVVPYFA